MPSLRITASARRSQPLKDCSNDKLARLRPVGLSVRKVIADVRIKRAAMIDAEKPTGGITRGPEPARAIVDSPSMVVIFLPTAGDAQAACFHWLAVDMDRADAAARYPAPVFVPVNPMLSAQDPEKRGLRFDVHRLGLGR